MEHVKEQELRSEIGFLGSILGDTIREFAGEEAFELVENLRRAAWDRRAGRANGDEQIKQLVAALDDEKMRVVIRAFTIFLDLLNLVEDRQRVKVLGERAREAYPQPRRESIRDAIATLKERGKSAAEIQSLIDRLHVELVFTAHPTDAKRRSVRSKLRAIRHLMRSYRSNQLPETRDRTVHEIRAEIAKLWQTDFIRPWRPSVMQEVGRGLSIKPVLWNEVPIIAEELATAVHESYGDVIDSKRSSVTFGSWIGGDRDGHPGVTAAVTADTFAWLRREAIQFHLRACEAQFDSLSISNRQARIGDQLAAAIELSVTRWPALADRLASVPPGELCRRWLSIIRWRLEVTLACCDESTAHLSQTASGGPETATASGAAYPTACELAGDVAVLAAALGDLPGNEFVAAELDRWRTQIDTFGLHLARLDVRQNASVYYAVVNEILRHTGAHEDPESLDEAGRCQLLSDTLQRPLLKQDLDLSAIAEESLSLFRTLHRVAREYSFAAIGAHVISMTSQSSDVLTVLWLWQQTSDREAAEEAAACVPIVPLLETIDDLQRGPAILGDMLSIPAYREHLRQQGDRQMIMLGYSDSTKDGGYLSSCWSLHQAQQQLVKIAQQHGIDLTFFHGRGGSLGRGGGPAARSIMSLPRGTFHGDFRLTEQGEVLADRYDDPAIAHRHLEQVLWSCLLAAGAPADSDSSGWYATMEQLAQSSLVKYRDLLEQPRFVEYFRRVTPISEIEQLPIGSRPSRRKPDGGLSDLRAIPWVFSWTQSRCLIPAWFGIGSAMGPLIDEESTRAELQSMYRQWPFFRALIDNAELALAKSDLEIAGEYARLADDDEALRAIGSLIDQEYRDSCRAVLALTECKELLDTTPWLKESIRVRNRFIDPLNLIQVELLRRGREPRQGEAAEELRHITRLSINGIAAGMRTSG